MRLPIRSSSVWCVVVCALMWGPIGPLAAAQSKSDFESARGDGIPLARALEQLATRSGANLVYDADLVRGRAASCALDDRPTETVLHCLLKGSELDFLQTPGGTYVIKKNLDRPGQGGTVIGVVWDENESRAIPYAHVRTRDGEKATVADTDGRFQLSNVEPGARTLVLQRIGYKETDVRISVSPGDTVASRPSMVPTPVDVRPVVVADHPSGFSMARKQDVVSGDELKDARRLGTPSVTQAAESLVGISTKAPYSDLYVQGGASTAHDVRLDGVPVRNPAASGRLLGAFSSLALGGLTAHKAGFGALHGNALSGVIDLNHELRRDDGHQAIVRADPVSVDGRMEGKTEVGGTRIFAMGAVRVGIWNFHRSGSLSDLINQWSVLDPALTAVQLSDDTELREGSFKDQRSRPRSQFYDLHGAARIEFSSTQHLYVSGFHGRSELGTDLVTTFDREEDEAAALRSTRSRRSVRVPATDRYDWSNTAAQARYQTRLSSRAAASIQGTLSRYRASSTFEEGRLATAAPGGASESLGADPPSESVDGSHTSSDVTEIGLTGTFDLKFGDESQLSILGEVTSIRTRFDGGNGFVGALHHRDQAFRFTTAGEWERGLGHYTTLELGLRTTARPGGGIYAEPRLALRHRRPETRVGDVAVRVGGGLYRRHTAHFQFNRDGATAVVPSAQLWTPVPSGFEPPRTYQLAADVTWGPYPGLTFGFEGYAKWQAHLLEVDYPALRSTGASDVTDPSQMFSASRGRAYGGGMRVAVEAGQTSTTLRYAYSYARRSFPGRFGGRRVATPWNEPHRASIDTEVSLSPAVSMDVRGTGIWGRSWAFRQAYYAYLTPQGVGGLQDRFDFSTPGDDVLPALYQLDVGLQAVQDLGELEMMGRVGVVNVLSRNNVADVAVRSEAREGLTQHSRTLPGRQLSMSIELRY